VVATNYFDKNALIQQVKSDQIKDIKDIKNHSLAFAPMNEWILNY